MGQKRTESKISPVQLRGIEALITYGTISAAATHAGIARSTFYRWLGQDDFVTALRQAETQALDDLSRSLASLGAKAVKALEDGLEPSQKAPIRLKAAGQVLDALLKLRELVDVEQRLQRLEQGVQDESE